MTRTTIIIVALLSVGPALAQDTGTSSELPVLGTITLSCGPSDPNGCSAIQFQMPALPDPQGPINDNFKRGACWAARVAFRGNDTESITFTGPPMFVCAPLTEKPK